MNGKVIFAFVLGAVSGAAATYLYFTNKQNNEKPTYISVPPLNGDIGESKSTENNPISGTTKIDRTLETDFKKYNKIITQHEYNKIYEVPDAPKDSPEIEYIDPDTFGDNDEYTTVFCTFYADGILTEGAMRNEDYIIDNPSKYIGENYEEHIKDDVLTCVNHRLKEYIEVTFVDENYNEEE